MTRRGASDLAVALVLKAVLDRIGRRSATPPRRRRRQGRAQDATPTAAPAPRPRRPLMAFMFGSLGLGLVLMLVFETTVTRVVGVLSLFAFIVSGVFLIADPAFLGPDHDSSDAHPDNRK